MSQGSSDLYAVFGNPIAHSKSPQIHSLFAAQSGQSMVYEKRLVPLDGFAAALTSFAAEGGRGANVTLPFKLQAHDLCQQLSMRARMAGAVNTLWWDEAGQLCGDNTDGIGLVTDIVSGAGQALQGKRILLLGAGGASRGAILPLLEQKPACLHLANRSVDKAHALCATFATFAQDIDLQSAAFSALTGSYDVIINATSASLQQALPAIPENLLGPHCLAYDMVYDKQLTPFLDYAQTRGARVRDGLGMLVEQAAQAFFIWRQFRPRTDEVYAALRAGL